MFKQLMQGFALILMAGLGMGLFYSNTSGADFPRKSIKLIATADVGGGEDTEARGLAPYLQKYLGVNVIVENQGGAGGKIAFEKFQKTEPDGHSLVLFTFPKSIIIEYMGKVNYRTKDFTPIYAWSRMNQLLVVHADNWKTFNEFLKAAKAKVLAGGLMGRGSTTHLAGLLAINELGIKVNWVPYEGSGQAVAALAGKHIDFIIGLSTSAISLIEAGKLRPLIFFNDERDPFMPDIPIPRDLGFNITSMPATRCAMAPPNTPASVVKVLEEAFSRAVKEPGYIEWAKKRKMVIHTINSQAFGKIVKDTYPILEKYQHMLKE